MHETQWATLSSLPLRPPFWHRAEVLLLVLLLLLLLQLEYPIPTLQPPASTPTCTYVLVAAVLAPKQAHPPQQAPVAAAVG